MSEENATQGIPFSAFVLSLSTMAMASLGQCDDPAFADMPRDPDIARNNINILLIFKSTSAIVKRQILNCYIISCVMN